MGKLKPGLLFLLIILGVLISLQYKVVNSGIKYVRVQDLYLLKNEIVRDRAEIEQYKKSLVEKKKELEKYSQSSTDTGQVERILRTDLSNQMTWLGLTNVQGPGIIILVTDSNRDLMENEQPENLMIHDYDIRAFVDDLFAAGAEAVSINDQRVVLTKRDIVCNGPTIRINNRLVAQPFVIKAIGDRDFLEAAVTAPGKYGNSLKLFGLFVEVNSSVNVEIPAYHGNLEFKHLKPVEENDKK